MSLDFYAVLGIEKDAPQDEGECYVFEQRELDDICHVVRKAYKRKALETHPDKTPLTTQEVKESAAARFRDVREAC